MLRIKKIDVFGQCILVAAAIITGLIWKTPFFIYGYLAVGGWQALSLLVHRFWAGSRPLHVGRDLFQKLAIIILATIIAALSVNMLFYLSLVLLYAYPFIALLYTWISNRELQVWEAKDLVHLK